MRNIVKFLENRIEVLEKDRNRQYERGQPADEMNYRLAELRRTLLEVNRCIKLS